MISNKPTSYTRSGSITRTQAKKDILSTKIIERDKRVRRMYFTEGIKIKQIASKIRVSTRTIDRTLRKLRKNSMRKVGMSSNPSCKSSYSSDQLRYLDMVSNLDTSIPLTV